MLGGRLRAGPGEGLGDDTECVGAGLGNGRGVGLGGGVARWDPRVGRLHRHGNRERCGQNCKKQEREMICAIFVKQTQVHGVSSVQRFNLHATIKMTFK